MQLDFPVALFFRYIRSNNIDGNARRGDHAIEQIMKLGLIADIHEDIDNLRWALAQFRAAEAEQVVFLGDAMAVGKRIDETCQQLREAGVIGVWGNHDLGLAFNPDDYFQSRYSPSVLNYMTTLKPRMVLGECHFSHVEPWLDPHDPSQINYFEGPSTDPVELARVFDSVTSRLMFCGHFHRWRLASSNEVLPWNGETPVSLANGRYWIIVRATFLGSCAVLDTDSWELTPYNR